MTTLPFKDVSWAETRYPSQEKINAPAIYIGELVLPPNNIADPLDTYIDPTGWGKVSMIIFNWYSSPVSGFARSVIRKFCETLQKKKKIISLWTVHPQFSLSLFKEGNRTNNFSKISPNFPQNLTRLLPNIFWSFFKIWSTFQRF